MQIIDFFINECPGWEVGRPCAVVWHMRGADQRENAFEILKAGFPPNPDIQGRHASDLCIKRCYDFRGFEPDADLVILHHKRENYRSLRKVPRRYARIGVSISVVLVGLAGRTALGHKRGHLSIDRPR